MTRLRGVLRAHAGAIILAALASVIVASPQIYFRIDHKSDGLYQGIELLPDSPWSPRVREIMDGHGFGSIYYKDGKDDPYLFQPLGSGVVAYLGSIFSLDINDTLLLSRVVFTPVVFLILYAFVFLLSRNRLAALTAAALLLFAESALSFSGLTEILRGMNPEDFLRIGRPVNPAMIYLLFFGFLIAFYKWFKQRKWSWGAASVALLGFNFYNYFYSWTFLYAFGAILFLTALLRKSWREALGIAGIYGGALILAIPWALNILSSSTFPGYAQIQERFGIVLTHGPLWIGFTALAALIIFFLLFPRGDRQRYFFALALLLTPFITLNQQIFTGKVVQPAHYHWFFHKPLAIIVIIIAALPLLARYLPPPARKALLLLVVLGSFGVGAFVQAKSYVSGAKEGGVVAIERQKYGPVTEWLSQNAEKEAVVLANDETSHMVVIYTPLNVFYHRAAMYTLAATPSRLRETLFALYRLRVVGEEDARETFFVERGFVSSRIYGMKYRETAGSYEAIPDEEIEKIVVEYQETLKTPTPEWLVQTFKKYDVAYAVWDQKTDPSWRLEQYSFFEKEAQFGDLAIYRFTAK